MKIKTQNLSKENFDEEIENILIEKEIITDEMVYEAITIGSVPFKSTEDEKNFIEEKCILIEDDEYYYICCQEKNFTRMAGEDYGVQRVEKRKYTYLN
ncbi:MAG: hypothetical protein IJH63_00515 [Methanobrevibacter sp.]|nr:hypothetical protein [Methanosphaera sp.]MBR0369186.1 hypothetical protein [Methanobrevibacter sp.]